MGKIPAPFVALLAVVVLVTLGWLVLRGDVIDEFRLPVIAVFAIAAMFAVIAFLVAMYQSTGLAVGTQALGLPEGSVRALIALSLIVIFAVLTLFVLTRLSSPKDVTDELAKILCEWPSTQADKEPPPAASPVPSPTAEPTAGPVASPPGAGGSNAGSTLGGNEAAGRVRTGGGGDPQPAPSPSGRQPEPGHVKQALDILSARQQAAQDLAKQLLGMLATLLTAVSSFYFGSSSTTSATRAGAAAARNQGQGEGAG